MVEQIRARDIKAQHGRRSLRPFRSLLNKLALAIDCPLALAGVGAELAQEQLKGSTIANLGSESRLMRSRLTQFVEGRLDT